MRILLLRPSLRSRRRLCNYVRYNVARSGHGAGSPGLRTDRRGNAGSVHPGSCRAFARRARAGASSFGRRRAAPASGSLVATASHTPRSGREARPPFVRAVRRGWGQTEPHSPRSESRWAVRFGRELPLRGLTDAVTFDPPAAVGPLKCTARLRTPRRYSRGVLLASRRNPTIVVGGLSNWAAELSDRLRLDVHGGPRRAGFRGCVRWVNPPGSDRPGAQRRAATPGQKALCNESAATIQRARYAVLPGGALLRRGEVMVPTIEEARIGGSGRSRSA